MKNPISWLTVTHTGLQALLRLIFGFIVLTRLNSAWFVSNEEQSYVTTLLVIAWSELFIAGLLAVLTYNDKETAVIIIAIPVFLMELLLHLGVMFWIFSYASNPLLTPIILSVMLFLFYTGAVPIIACIQACNKPDEIKYTPLVQVT